MYQNKGIYMFNDFIKDVLKETFFKNLDISTDIEFQKRLNLIKNNKDISKEDKNILIDRLNASYINCKSDIKSIKLLLDASKLIHQFNSIKNNRFIAQQELKEIFARNARY